MLRNLPGHWSKVLLLTAIARAWSEHIEHAGLIGPKISLKRYNCYYIERIQSYWHYNKISYSNTSPVGLSNSVHLRIALPECMAV